MPQTTRDLPADVRILELEAEVSQLRSDVLDLAAALQSPHGGGSSNHHHPQAPAHPHLDQWVDHYFLAVFARPVGGEIRWCSRWREHPEAVTRLEALWRSWETMRLDANLGMAVWLTNYCDPILSTLTNRSGTFAQCTPDRHAPTMPAQASEVREAMSSPESAASTISI